MAGSSPIIQTSMFRVSAPPPGSSIPGHLSKGKSQTSSQILQTPDQSDMIVDKEMKKK